MSNAVLWWSRNPWSDYDGVRGSSVPWFMASKILGPWLYDAPRSNIPDTDNAAREGKYIDVMK